MLPDEREEASGTCSLAFARNTLSLYLSLSRSLSAKRSAAYVSYTFSRNSLVLLLWLSLLSRRVSGVLLGSLQSSNKIHQYEVHQYEVHIQ